MIGKFRYVPDVHRAAREETDLDKRLGGVLALVLAVGLLVVILGATGCAPSKPTGVSQNTETVTGGAGTAPAGGDESSGTTASGAKASWHEQDDPDIAYQGKWTTFAHPIHSAGSYAFTKTQGSKVTIKFHGTAITYITAKDAIYGIAKVTLDGGTPISVDLYNAGGPTGQQKVWHASDLPDADHTLVIECTGAKNDASGAKYIGLDAVDVTGTLIDAH